MATLQYGEKARMYALGKIARGGATRGGYVSAHAFITIDGVHVGVGGTPGAAHVGVLLESLSISDALNEAANTCTFRLNGQIPNAGAEVRITTGSKNRINALFAGLALRVDQGYAADKPANIQADCSCVDYTWLFGFVKVTAAYRSLSATAIAADLVARFASANGFTANAVAPNLPSLNEITFTNEELDQALTRLAQRIGAYWYVDYQKDIHFFIDETTNGDPEWLVPQHRSLADVRRTADRTQVLTRVYVEGRGTSVLGAVAAGDTMIPVEAIDMFEAAPDVFAKVSPHGSAGAAEWVSYTGVIPGGAGSLVGPGGGPPGAPTVAAIVGVGLAAGSYKYAYTDVTPSGESLPSPLGLVDVGAPIAPPTKPAGTDPFSAHPGVDPGVHRYAYTYSIGAVETSLGPPSAVTQTYSPMSAPVTTMRLVAVTGGTLPTGAAYYYSFTYIGNGGGETTRGEYNGINLFGGATAVQITVPAPSGQAIPFIVSRVNFYRSSTTSAADLKYIGGIDYPGSGAVQFNDTGLALGAPIPTVGTAVMHLGRVRVTTAPSPDPTITGVNIYRQRYDLTPYKLVARITAPRGETTYDDVIPDASLGPAAPTINTSGDGIRAVAVSNIAPGPAPTNRRNLYRTAVNGAQLKLLAALFDNTTTTITDTQPDTSLQTNAPTIDTSGLSQAIAGQVPAGSTAILVAFAGPFEAGGGWAVIGNGEQAIRYTGKTASALTGIPSAGIGAIVAGISYNSTITAAPMVIGIPSSGPLSIVEAINAGDELNLVVKREDAARQTALATMIKIGPGWREEWIQDRRLSAAEARARGDATLALRPLEELTLTYRCRDLRTASGKTITVNLPAPTNLNGSFKIQSVTISNFRPYANQYPTFTVTASSSRFSFEDWLRQMQTKV